MSKTKWYQKPSYVLVALALVLSLGLVAVPMAGTVEANGCCHEAWVDDDADASWYNVTCHFDTIQKGIDAVCDNGTVHVAAGTYEEGDKYSSIKIKDKSLTLLGAQADIPIVNGERAGDESIIRGKGTGFPPYAPSSWCVVRIQHSNVVINGFTIENGKRAIAIQGPCEDILVSYNYIENSGYDGISRDNAAADVTIDHNYIASNPRGIATRGGATTITDNTFYGNGKGIDFLHGDPSAMYFPDYAEPNYPTMISGNAFTKDKTSIKLSLRGHQPIAITGNDITEARSAAIKTVGWGEDLVNPAIHYNNIWNNEFGINNQVTEINLDATYNWWGDASGPSSSPTVYDPVTGVAADGSGDAVSANVCFDPWLKGPFPSVEAAFSILDDLCVEIDELLATDFNNAKQQKALLNKVDAVFKQIEAGAYQGAINKLQNDVKDKIEKWIVEGEQPELIKKVNAVIAVLEDLLE